MEYKEILIVYSNKRKDNSILFVSVVNFCVLTAEPLRVVLVCSHCIPLGQAPEDGSICPHEVNVHA